MCIRDSSCGGRKYYLHSPQPESGWCELQVILFEGPEQWWRSLHGFFIWSDMAFRLDGNFPLVGRLATGTVGEVTPLPPEMKNVTATLEVEVALEDPCSKLFRGNTKNHEIY